MDEGLVLAHADVLQRQGAHAGKEGGEAVGLVLKHAPGLVCGDELLVDEEDNAEDVFQRRVGGEVGPEVALEVRRLLEQRDLRWGRGGVVVGVMVGRDKEEGLRWGLALWCEAIEMRRFLRLTLFRSKLCALRPAKALATTSGENVAALSAVDQWSSASWKEEGKGERG